MTTEQITAELTTIFRKVFKAPDLELDPSLTPNDVDNWNSLNNTIMIYEVEEAFGIKIPLREMITIKTVGDLIAIIERHTAA